MEGNSSLYVTDRPGLVAIGIVVVEIKCFSINHLTLRDHVFKGLKFLTVSQHFAKFSSHRLCGSSDTAANIFYEGTRDQRIWDLWKGTPNFISHPGQIYSHKHCVNVYITILGCHVILQDHVIKKPCDFMCRSHSR